MQGLPRAVVASAYVAVGQHSSIQGSRAGPTDALDVDTTILQQSIQHAPSERSVRAASLECKIDPFCSVYRCVHHRDTASCQLSCNSQGDQPSPFGTTQQSP